MSQLFIVTLNIFIYLNWHLTSLEYPVSELETVTDSSGMPPDVRPRSPTGLQSMVVANPALHLQKKLPGVFTHSADARSHWLLAHSFISMNIHDSFTEYILVHILEKGDELPSQQLTSYAQVSVGLLF